ncbi:GDSL-type esterase/lipase family protein [uncultured Rikenella sp.]|uniref:GDSL-type esterase/lipase family protein n=1 Tax=uncultured Rikenella sp. TaxID=368003 RepID=UPI0025D32D20|nr:GDSL-type esterase/lipase family protein [uncultured Rikenella sp.]
MRRICLTLCALLVVSGASGARRPAAVKPAPVRVACVGNSITYGMLVEDRERNCYPAVLGRMLGAGYDVRNFGHSGATLLNKGHNPYTKTKEYAEAIAFRPDIVVIHLGINDTDPRNWPNFRDEFIPDYAALIESFREANPAAKVYICRMTPIPHRHRRFKAGTRDWHHQIQEAIERVAASQRTGLIDLEPVLKDRPELLPDAVHPNVEGARLLAEEIYRALTGDYGKLRMSPAYTDRMVLQRGVVTRIGGRANAGRLVTVTVADTVRRAKSGRLRFGQIAASDTVTAGADGWWEVRLPLEEPMLSGVLAIATEDTVALYRDVAVGEVWIAAGQSNMSWPVARAAERAEARPTGRIRLFRANPTFADERGRLDSTELARLNRLDYIRNPQGWVSGSDTAAVEEFSAVAWFFGQMLADSLGAEVPVGLIEISLGGAPAEAFVSRRILEDDPALVDVLYDWRNNEMAQDWVRGVIRGNLEGVKNPLQRHFFEPAYLYESRVAPLAAGYDAEGVIWYQGESNAHNAELHERLFPAVVKSFREAFGQNSYGGLMPFYFVQLSSLNRPSWPHFRDSQRRLEERLHGWDDVHMVVSSDLGDSTDVHPRHKKPIGERLARRCLFQRYSYPNRFKSLETAQSPTVIDGATQYYDTVFVDFSRPLATLDDEPVRGFEIEVADGKFYPATGRIEGRQVILTASSEGPLRLQGTPPRIRYGWQPFTRANLCGVAPYRMPVSTFEIRVNCSKH